MSKNTLKQKYEKEIVSKLQKELDIKNKMSVPKIEKIVVNSGIGDLSKNKEGRGQIVEDITRITGQKPSVRKARISVAGFNLREGMPVGVKTTLRGVRMYDFYQKLVSIVLPRLRDFRGVSEKSFDKNGNYSLGLKDHTVFPEVDSGKISNPRGIEITIVTSTADTEKAKKLLELMGMPFEKVEDK